MTSQPPTLPRTRSAPTTQSVGYSAHAATNTPNRSQNTTNAYPHQLSSNVTVNTHTQRILPHPGYYLHTTTPPLVPVPYTRNQQVLSEPFAGDGDSVGRNASSLDGSKSRIGTRAGIPNFTKYETRALLDAVEEHEPLGSNE